MPPQNFNTMSAESIKRKAQDEDEVPVTKRARIQDDEPPLIETYERTKRNVIKQIIDDWDIHAPSIVDDSKCSQFRRKMPSDVLLKKLKAYLAAAREGRRKGVGVIKITYKTGEQSDGVGRMFAYHKDIFGLSLQNLPKIIVNTITQGWYRDFDIVNSMPTIFCQYAQRHGLPVPFLAQYVEDRWGRLAELEAATELEPSEGKQAVCAFFFCGSSEAYKTVKEAAEELEWIREVKAEIRAIQEYVMKHEPRIVKLAKNKNTIGSVMALLYGDLENEIVQAALQYLEKKNYIVKNTVTLSFDGFKVYDPEMVLDAELACAGMSKAVLAATGYNVKFVEKTMDEVLHVGSGDDDGDDMDDDAEPDEDVDTFELPDLDVHAANLNRLPSHGFSAKYVKNVVMGEHYKYCSTRSTWYRCKKGIWDVVEDPSVIKNIFDTSITELIKTRRALQKKIRRVLRRNRDASRREQLQRWNVAITAECVQWDKLEELINNDTFADKCGNYLRSLFQVTEFAERLDSQQNNFLPFTDQVFHFDTCEWESLKPEHFVSKTTGYPRPQSNPKIRAKIMEILRGIQWTEECVQYLLCLFAILLPPKNLFQNIIFLLGPGGNGKTLLFNLLEYGLHTLFVSMPSHTITKGKKSANDHDSFSETIGSRVCCYEEPEDNDYLQTGIVKLMTGDSIISTRPAYGKKNIRFRPTWTALMNCNSMPKVSKIVDALMRRIIVLIFPFIFKFADDPSYDPKDPTHKIRDTSLEDFTKSREAGQEFILLLLDTWMSMTKPTEKPPVPTKYHRDATLKYFEESDSIIQFIREGFTVTKSPDDRLFTSYLLTKCQEQVSKNVKPNVLRQKLEKLGVTKTHSDKDYFYVGIRHKTSGDNVDDEEVSAVEVAYKKGAVLCPVCGADVYGPSCLCGEKFGSRMF